MINKLYSTLVRVIKNSLIFYPILMVYRRIKHLYQKRNQNGLNNTLDFFLSNIKSRKLILYLDEFNGEFEFDVRSDILRRYLIYGKYEPETISLIKQNLNANEDFIDVGANIGLFSIFASKLLDRKSSILAIEPTPNASNILTNNIKRNNLEGMILFFQGVVTDVEGTLELETIDGMEEYSSLGKIVQVNKGRRVHIQVVSNTIDKLVKIYNVHPGLIKIDTEGAEFRVLSGAIETIKKYKPTIISELCDDYLSTMNNTSQQVINLLRSLNYTVINLQTNNEEIKIPFRGNILATPN